MQKYMLLLLISLVFLACETGTKYDKNETKEVSKVPSKSGLVLRTHESDIEALLGDDDKEEERAFDDEDVSAVVIAEDKVFLEEPVVSRAEPVEEIQSEVVQTFTGGKIDDGLEIKKIREGKHDGYVRLVFDVYEQGKPAKKVGAYKAEYRENKNDIAVTIEGYRKFSASLPSFSASSDIEQIYFDKYLDDSSYKFHIKLRTKAKVRIFTLPDPARLIFDIKAI